MPLPNTYEERLDAAEEQLFIQKKMKQPPTHPEHLATKGYVDELIEGMRWNAVTAASDADMAGTLDATFNILTASANGAFPTVDTVAPALDTRYLLFGQADATTNGLYTLTALGDAGTPWVLTRVEDANADGEFHYGKMVAVLGGDSYKGVTFKLTTEGDIVLGTSELEFAEVANARLDEERVEIIGANVAYDANVVHTLNTEYVTVNAFDAEFHEIGVGSIPVDKTTVRIITGAALPTGTYTLLLRGRLG